MDKKSENPGKIMFDDVEFLGGEKEVEMVMIMIPQNTYEVFSKLAHVNGIAVSSELSIALKNHIEDNKHRL